MAGIKCALTLLGETPHVSAAVDAGQLELFQPSPNSFRDQLARRVAAWTTRGVYWGGSSWKYPGWLGQIYRPERYQWRGRFSAARFHRECLREYAEVFPTVCGDFSFYTFYEPRFWQELFASVPVGFRFGFKAPQIITSPDVEGTQFLNVALLTDRFLERLAPYRAQVGYIVFEFPLFRQPMPQFLDRLGDFLRALPTGFHYAVEIRTRDLLGADYFQLLRSTGTAHVINSWTHMPTIGEQLQLPGVFTTEFTVVRALLRPGRNYEEAVRLFQPYRELRDPWPEGFRDIAEVIRRRPGEVFVAVNNRFAGNTPLAIDAILTELESAKP